MKGALIAGALLMSGCSGTIQMEAPSPQNSTVKAAKLKANRPYLILEELSDQRADPETLGQMGGRLVEGKQFPSLVMERLKGRLKSGWDLEAKNPESEATPHLQVKLVKAYIDSVAVSRTAVVVLEISVRDSNGGTRAKVFRGQFAAMNWWNTSSEAQSALVQALDVCIGKIEAELPQLLKQS